MRRSTDDERMVCGGGAEIDISMNQSPTFSFFEVDGTSWDRFRLVRLCC